MLPDGPDRLHAPVSACTRKAYGTRTTAIPAMAMPGRARRRQVPPAAIRESSNEREPADREQRAQQQVVTDRLELVRQHGVEIVEVAERIDVQQRRAVGEPGEDTQRGAREEQYDQQGMPPGERGHAVSSGQ